MFLFKEKGKGILSISSRLYRIKKVNFKYMPAWLRLTGMSKISQASALTCLMALFFQIKF